MNVSLAIYQTESEGLRRLANRLDAGFEIFHLPHEVSVNHVRFRRPLSLHREAFNPSVQFFPGERAGASLPLSSRTISNRVPFGQSVR
jgi:hypothetical protein